MSNDKRQPGPSRRQFLVGLGVTGAGLVATGTGAAPVLSGLAAAAAEPRVGPGLGTPASAQLFGRIFVSLPPFAAANDTVRAALLEVGQPGGIMDAHDNLAAGPKALIVDPTVNGNPTATDPYGTNPDNPTMTAGSTFVGQFTDHDITFDQTSQLGVPQNPLVSPNTRTPALDLDSVFGGGPGLRPDLYVANRDGSVGPKLQLGTGGVHEDVPRVANGDGTYTAVLGDPRNDENVMIAGLHCAHILFYNQVLDELGQLRSRPRSRPHERASRPGQPVRGLPGRPRGDLVALPVAVGQRTPAPDRGPGPRRRRLGLREPLLPAPAGRRLHAHRVRGGRLPLRSQHGPPVVSGQLHQRHRRLSQPYRRSVLCPGLRRHRDRLQRAGQTTTATTCSAAFPLPDAMSAGRPSSTSGTARSKTTRRSTPPSPACCSPCRCPPSPPTPRPPPWRYPSATCCANSPGACPPAKPSPRPWAPTRSTPPTWPTSPPSTRRSGPPPRCGTTSWPKPKPRPAALNLGPVGGRIVAETLIGLLRADPTSYLNLYPRFQPFLGTDLTLGPTPNPNITGNRSYTRAHFLYYAGVLTPGTYR